MVKKTKNFIPKVVEIKNPYGRDIKLRIEEPGLTTGWLNRNYLSELEADMDSYHSADNYEHSQFLHFKSKVKNTKADFLLTNYNESVSNLPNGYQLTPIFIQDYDFSHEGHQVDFRRLEVIESFEKHRNSLQKAQSTFDSHRRGHSSNTAFSSKTHKSKDNGSHYLVYTTQQPFFYNLHLRTNYQRALRELHIWTDCQHHPMIPRVRHCSYHRGVVCILSEYKGETPASQFDMKRIKEVKIGELSKAELWNREARVWACLVWFAEMLLVLEYFHKEKKVMIRDIKPEDLLIDQRGHLKFNHFENSREGVSKDLYSFRGHHQYSAPEMLSKDAYESPGVDLYSLGVVLYELLTGFPPFEENDKKLILKQKCRRELQFPRTMDSEIADMLRELLRSDPRTRITSYSHYYSRLDVLGINLKKLKKDRYGYVVFDLEPEDYFKSRDESKIGPSLDDIIDEIYPEVETDNLEGYTPEEADELKSVFKYHGLSDLDILALEIEPNKEKDQDGSEKGDHNGANLESIIKGNNFDDRIGKFKKSYDEVLLSGLLDKRNPAYVSLKTDEKKIEFPSDVTDLGLIELPSVHSNRGDFRVSLNPRVFRPKSGNTLQLMKDRSGSKGGDVELGLSRKIFDDSEEESFYPQDKKLSGKRRKTRPRLIFETMNSDEGDN